MRHAGMTFARALQTITITNEPKSAEDAYFIAGVVSTILYGAFTLCCVWRSFFSFPKFKHSFENKKMVIHVTLTLFGFFELVYGISHIIVKRDTVWGYFIHILGTLFVLISFSMIPLIWTKILSYGSNYASLRLYIVIVLVLNITITTFQAILLLRSNSVYDNGQLEEGVTITRALIVSGSLFFFSIWLLSYGTRIYIFLSSSHVRSNDIVRTERRKAIRRVLIVVGACSICYLLRAFCVTLIMYDYFNETFYTNSWFSDIGWYLCSQWVPHLIPASIMLYVCRPVVKKKPHGQNELRIRSISSNYASGDHNSTDSSDNIVFSMSSNIQSSTGDTNDSYSEYFTRYSNDMYKDFSEDDFDYEVEEACTPGHPFTVDEILQSSDKYGASTSPFSDQMEPGEVISP